MSENEKFENAYLAITRNPAVYQEQLAESAAAVLKDAAKALDATRTSMWLMSEDRRTMSCISRYDAATDSFDNGAVMERSDFPNYFYALLEERVIDATDVAVDPRTSELRDTSFLPQAVSSLLDATIRNARDGGLQGVLSAEIAGRQRAWTDPERHFAASISDLLSQRLLASQLAWNTRAYSAIFESTSQGIMLFDGQFFQDVNPAACELFGALPSDIAGRTPVDFSPPFQPDGEDSKTKALRYIQRCLEGEVQRFDWVHTRLDGSDFDAEVTLNLAQVEGETRVFALIRDITTEKEAEREAAEARRELEYRAAHDSLTGLKNREQLHLDVAKLIAAAEANGGHLALALLDLNRFKEINDTLGHLTGDKVLIAVAERLAPFVTKLGGTLFRLGGDEFVVALGSLANAAEADRAVEAIRSHLAAPIHIDGASVEMTASLGSALFPDDGSDSHELLRCADVAMYHAKQHADASPWYRPENDLHDRRRLSIVSDLRKAINGTGLELYYQPRVDIQTGDTTGCEALIRWRHPEHGLLLPAEFLPLTEMGELMHPLTSWVINKAFDQLLTMAQLDCEVPVAVNVSARDLPDSQLFDLIERKLEQFGLPPELLEVEITESALINNPRRSLQNLQRLEALGVSIAIDDFGTGYSSLSMLKELPIDKLKIDRSFVNDMIHSERDHVIVNSIVSLAHNFSASVVAEGVEDRATLDALQALSCDEAQGYYIAPPMPAENFIAWLAESSADRPAA